MQLDAAAVHGDRDLAADQAHGGADACQAVRAWLRARRDGAEGVVGGNKPGAEGDRQRWERRRRVRVAQAIHMTGLSPLSKHLTEDNSEKLLAAALPDAGAPAALRTRRSGNGR
jgi:hypothetical protein